MITFLSTLNTVVMELPVIGRVSWKWVVLAAGVGGIGVYYYFFSGKQSSYSPPPDHPDAPPSMPRQDGSVPSGTPPTTYYTRDPMPRIPAPYSNPPNIRSETYTGPDRSSKPVLAECQALWNKNATTYVSKAMKGGLKGKVKPAGQFFVQQFPECQGWAKSHLPSNFL